MNIREEFGRICRAGIVTKMILGYNTNPSEEKTIITFSRRRPSFIGQNPVATGFESVNEDLLFPKFDSDIPKKPNIEEIMYRSPLLTPPISTGACVYVSDRSLGLIQVQDMFREIPRPGRF